jgi:nitrogen fixation/metabolism regulation signal transduction histidine kinase
VRAAGLAVRLEGEANNSSDPLRVRVIVAVESRLNTSLLSRDELFLQLIQPVPPGLAVNAEAVEEVSREYHQLALARQGLRQIYGITLTMTLLLAVFAAVVAALLLAQRFAKPLQVLAEGTRAVASGDYRPLPATEVKDEIGALTESFNQMTQQLHDARQAVQIRETELARTNQYLERLLANISAGVLVFDSEFQLLTANEAAEKILGAALRTDAGSPLRDISALQPLAEELLAEFAVPRQDGGTWQHQFDIQRDAQEATLVLLARGSRLEMAEGSGYVVVFDDVTAVMSGQRALAWSEVARRLAHEIKNPLTPIQLSAERLEMKLAPKLAPEDVQMLRKSTGTIVTQVEAMKRMVNEFRDYSRMPPAELRPIDLNALIEQVVTLYGQEDAVLLQLQPDLPWIEGDATHLRQVIHNLVLNALDSVHSAKAESPLEWGDVVIRTKALEYALADGSSRVAVRLEVQDKGLGFSSKILSRAFEPYVTTKPKGTGLGLAIVRKIVDEHEARIELANLEPTKKLSGVSETAAAVSGRSGAGALVSITFSRLATADHRG